MVTLLALLLAGAPPGGSLPERRIILREVKPLTQVSDKDLRPTRPPDCKTDADVARAVQQVRSGQAGDCWVRDAAAFNRHGG
ncbi:MAG: hypothetical protein ACTHN4_01600 [Sphingomicrobium sp.]